MQSKTEHADAGVLRDECRHFSRYLLGREPDSYVLSRYVSLQPAAVDSSALGPLDALLLDTARSGLLGARIADAFARVFRPRGVLRRKLILLFAILENSREFHAHFTAGVSSTLVRLPLRLAAIAVVFGLAFSASLVVIGPRALLVSWRSRGTA